MNFAPRAQSLGAAEAAVLAVAVEPAFDFAGDEYRALHQRSRASVFQSPRWLEAMWRDLAPVFGVEPVTLTVRDAATRQLMLALPLARRRQHGVTVLEFADFGLCDYHAAVYDLDEVPLLDADATLPKRIVAALPRHDVLALEKLTGDDPLLERLFPGVRRASMRQSAYPSQLTSDWKTWRDATLSQGFRRELDMKRRKLGRAGDVQFVQLRDPDEIDRAFEALRRYRSARFKTIGVPDLLDHEPIFAFYRLMAIDGAREGFARTECLYLSGEPIAVQFGLTQRGVYSMLLIGPDIARHHRLSPGLLAVDASLRAAIEGGDRVFDFTIGDHPYKQQFGAQAIPLYEWHRARTLRGHVALLAITLTREAKRVLKPLLKRRKTLPPGNSHPAMRDAPRPLRRT
jgi:CelD/BcsL family acetyltransferase involved in cellulose biosynthesis